MSNQDTNRIPLIYIMSANHSGSTLLSHILHAHSKIVSLGEIEKIASFVPQAASAPCTCGDAFAECSFWKELVQKKELSPMLTSKLRHILQSNTQFLLNSDSFHFRCRGTSTMTVPQYLQGMELIYQYALRKAHADLVVDSTKNIHQITAYSRKSDAIVLYVIHLVRDPRGVMWSYQKKYGRWFYGMKHWLSTNIKTSIMKYRLPRDVYVRTVRYEDLVTSPKQVLRNILCDVDLQFEDKMLKYQAVPHHFCGGNRKTSIKTSAIQPDNAWKQKLSRVKKIIGLIGSVWLYRLY